MIKNLTAKVILIIAVLIFFLFGIFGIPKSFTPSGLLAALQERIHLGLDLKGGTHLILQVQVNDAVNADSDRAIERLKDDLKSKNIGYGEISKPDPQQHPELISVHSVRINRRIPQPGRRPAAGLRPGVRRGELVHANHEAQHREGHEGQGAAAGDRDHPQPH
jgi:preprotein translocase subunit SecD